MCNILNIIFCFKKSIHVSLLLKYLQYLKKSQLGKFAASLPEIVVSEVLFPNQTPSLTTSSPPIPR